MGLEAVKMLLYEIGNEKKIGQSKIYIEEEFLWRRSVKRKKD